MENRVPYANNYEEPKKNNGIGGLLVVIGFFVGIIVFLIWILSQCLNTNKVDEVSALIDSQQFVLKKLKSPSTAEFELSSSGVTKRSENVYWVESYVDAQNGFGATVRTYYECLITYTPNKDEVTCTELSINED